MTPIRLSLFLALAATLSACGGGPRETTAPRAFATGPIQTACLQAGRDGASRQLCGCVQAVANTSLSAGDQSRAVEFFRTPHLAQEVRQSDRARDEAFWKRYRTFFEATEQFCR
ncbi:MAG: arginine transporter [Pseudomonadota bacterium]